MTARLNLNDHYIVPKPETEDEKAVRRAQLIDEIRALNAQAAGKRIEVCMLDGDRHNAQFWADEQRSLVLARKAARGVAD